MTKRNIFPGPEQYNRRNIYPNTKRPRAYSWVNGGFCYRDFSLRANAGLYLLLIVLFLSGSGCAVYRTHLGKASFDKGYVVSRNDYTIPEYTIGGDNSVPDIDTAKQRFKRRRKVVEDYYKKMGYIENNFKRNIWNPCWSFMGVVGGVFRLPFIAVSDYRYEHNPKYKDSVDLIEKERASRDKSRIKTLKERLDSYLEEDLKKENSLSR